MFLPLFAQAQRCPVEPLAAYPGLSQPTVKCLLQDRKGYLWVGTENGLNRYDGYGFVQFKNRQDNPGSISNNIINGLCEDREGYLWVATNNGLNRFDPKTESFRRFLHDPRDPGSLAAKAVHCIYEDWAGTLWAGVGTSIERLEQSTGTFRHFPLPVDAPRFMDDNAVRAIAGTGKQLFVGTWGDGVWQFNPETGAFRRANLHGSIPGGHNWVNKIWKEASGTLYAIINSYAYAWDAGNNRFNPLEPITPRNEKAGTTYFSEIPGSRFLVGTYGEGIKICTQEFRETGVYCLQPSENQNQPGITITTILKDRGGIYWLGTAINGLFKFDPEQNRFQDVFSSRPRSELEPVKNISGVVETPSGLIWLSSRTHGLLAFDQAKSAVASLDGIDIPYKKLSCVFRDSRNRIWIGSWGAGVYVYDPKTGTVGQFLSDTNRPNRLTDNFIMSFCESADGDIWIGTVRGISVIGPDELASGVFRQYLPDPAVAGSLSHFQVNVMCCDHAGRIWVGTADGGLNLYQPSTDNFRHFLHNPADPATLGSNRVLALLEDHKNRLWVGTWGGGLNRYDPEQECFVHFNGKDGPSNDAISGIAEDGKGRLWLTTSQGLLCFDPKAGRFSSFFEKDGLPDQAFSARAIMLCRQSGKILGGGQSGIAFFHPDSIRSNRHVPPVVITSLKRYNAEDGASRLADIPGISYLDRIVLPYSDNTLTVSFAALNFRDPSRNQYAFMLEGLSRHWTPLGAKREVTFSKLPPGDYVLRVKGSNNDGLWNEQGATLTLSILPPWYRSWWAYLSYLFAAGAIFYFVRQKELRQQQLQYHLELERLESEKLKEMDQLKSHFFANISHEFRTPLTLILGQIDSVAHRLPDNAEKSKLWMAYKNGKRLHLLIDQLLDLSKLEARSMALHARRQDLVPVLKSLCYAFGSLAEQRAIRLRFLCEAASIPMDVDAEKLEKIVFNLLSNAIRFTPEGGEVTMSVEQVPAIAPEDQPRVKIAIRDTGIGIPAGHLPHLFDRFYQVDASPVQGLSGTGIGLALVRELVELHHGQVEVDSREGQGSVFSVTLPLKQQQQTAAAMPPPDAGETTDLSWLHAPPTVQAGKKAGNNALQLLLVEDNPDVRAYLADHLSEAGYGILEAIDGMQGLALAREHLPDLIITDVMMPRMDGHAFSREIRSDERTSHIPIIMLTARAGEADKIEGLETGVDDYLVKPFHSRELLVRVANLIHLRQQLRKRFSTATVIRPSEVSAVSVDQQFLEKVIRSIEAHLADEQFGLEPLSAAVGMSPTHLNRKLNALLGQSAGSLIRSMRLQRAAELLLQNAGTVKDIAYQVGFSVPENFSRSFKKQFGCAPGEYRSRK